MENTYKEISKIKIANQEYNIKDTFAREKLIELLGEPKKVIDSVETDSNQIN